MAAQKSLLINLTRISSLHLYKGRSPITKRYVQQLIDKCKNLYIEAAQFTFDSCYFSIYWFILIYICAIGFMEEISNLKLKLQVLGSK